jgi:non-specific serine/threonine protein kinase
LNVPYHNKALPEGTVLREWRLEQVLGVGGFGIVYQGKDVYFGETVAIKEYFPGAISDRLDGVTVAPTDSSSEEIYELGRKKFVEEAKVLWNLSQPERHPNIVAVRSLFEIHGTAYMVMDFESGVSLSEMLRNGQKFDEKSLLAIIRPIAEGLDRAHCAGVLHRDIKPANILISKGERPVLIDFGSARFDSGQATNTKVTFYTPPYAAIEQYVKTFPQGAWTDIYALGVVLYQCVTGEKPPEVLERLHGGLGQSLSAHQAGRDITGAE